MAERHPGRRRLGPRLQTRPRRRPLRRRAGARHAGPARAPLQPRHQGRGGGAGCALTRPAGLIHLARPRQHERMPPMRLPAALLLAPALAAATMTLAQTEPHIAYPATARGDVVEEQFGERVADPYRWLEN